MHCTFGPCATSTLTPENPESTSLPWSFEAFTALLKNFVLCQTFLLASRSESEAMSTLRHESVFVVGHTAGATMEATASETALKPKLSHKGEDPGKFLRQAFQWKD